MKYLCLDENGLLFRRQAKQGLRMTSSMTSSRLVQEAKNLVQQGNDRPLTFRGGNENEIFHGLKVQLSLLRQGKTLSTHFTYQP